MVKFPNVYLLLISFFFVLSSFAQENREFNEDDLKINGQFWIDYNFNYTVEDDKSFSGLVGFRSISPHAYNQFILEPTFNFLNTGSQDFLHLDKPLFHSFHLGGGYYYTYNYGAQNSFEFRLMQGLKFNIPPINTIILKNYVRLEERFQKTFNGSNWSSGYRLRYRISTVLKWNKYASNTNEGLYIPLNAEFFVNLKKSDRFNDILRLSPGIGYKLNDGWKFELYGSYHLTKNTIEEDFTSNDFVLRLRIYRGLIKRGIIVKDEEDDGLKELIE